MPGELLDLGLGHSLRYARWAPDRALNPRYAHLPDVDRYCALHTHPRPDGAPCGTNGLTFDGPVQRELDPARPRWQVVSWEPLTLSPSVLCTACQAHGWIRDGRWVPA